jgi:hypothetical protein
LPFVARAFVLFLSLAVLTSLILGTPISLPQVTLLAGLYTVPYLLLMAGGVPTLGLVTPERFARFQVRMLPVVSILPVVLAILALRRQPRVLSILTVVLMALFMVGYPFVGLLPDDRKRNAIEGGIQIAMIAYVFLLTLFIRVRKLGAKSSRGEQNE